MNKFKSAKEFANKIKDINEDYEFHKIDDEELNKRKEFLKSHYGRELQTEYDNQNPRYQGVVDNIIKCFEHIFPSSFANFVNQHFYFTTLEIPTINAQIYRSKDKQYFAVFLNASLIDLLTKYGKLTTAIKIPDAVEYCSRTPGRKPTIEELIAINKEYFKHFETYKVAYGPYIVLKPTAGAIHIMSITIQEKFIIFHEFAHFLNGDLFDLPESFSDIYLKEHTENRAHRKEHFADMLAFHLLLESEKIHGEITFENRLQIMFSIISLFDVFYILKREESATHPNPIRRLYCVIENFYGSKFADVLELSYRDRSASRKWLSMESELDSIEDSFTEIVSFLITNSSAEEYWT